MVKPPPDPRVPGTYPGMKEALGRLQGPVPDPDTSRGPLGVWMQTAGSDKRDGVLENMQKAFADPAPANPMHPRDRLLYVILAWSAVPATLVVGCFIAWGSGQLPLAWAVSGIALGLVGMVAATIFALERKLPSPRNPGPIIAATAALTWALIGWQTWMWIHNTSDGLTQQQVDEKVAAATLEFREKLDIKTKELDDARRALNDSPKTFGFSPAVGPIPPGPIGPFTPSWEDALNFERAFSSLPRPCVAKIVPNTNDELYARNVLSAILRMNDACGVIDERIDQVPRRVDVDAPTPQKFSGLIVRWHSDFVEGDKLFTSLRGFYHVEEGHAMPDNSPRNLILIQVGSGRWHR